MYRPEHQVDEIDDRADGALRPADWHPHMARLHDYWRAIHPAGGLPGRRHFDPMAVAPLLPNIWLLDVQPEPFRLKYRLVGTAVVAAHRRELTGLWLDEAHPHLKERPDFFARYRTVAESRRPSWRKGQPYMDHYHRTVENLLLPLARDGCGVDMILCISHLHDPVQG